MDSTPEPRGALEPLACDGSRRDAASFQSPNDAAHPYAASGPRLRPASHPSAASGPRLRSTAMNLGYLDRSG
eukprot:7121833-Alexandrium_andersonii.AAC.1